MFHETRPGIKGFMCLYPCFVLQYWCSEITDFSLETFSRGWQLRCQFRISSYWCRVKSGLTWKIPTPDSAVNIQYVVTQTQWGDLGPHSLGIACYKLSNPGHEYMRLVVKWALMRNLEPGILPCYFRIFMLYNSIANMRISLENLCSRNTPPTIPP